MGYTHYWTYRPQGHRYHSSWPSLVTDTRTILDAVLDASIGLAGPHGYGQPVVDLRDGIAFNGIAGTTDWLSAEPFRLQPPEPEPRKGSCFAFCKTLRRPYDVAVTAVLLRVRLVLGEDFTLSSDGAWDREWAYSATSPTARSSASESQQLSARSLIHELFGDVPHGEPHGPPRHLAHPIVT